MQHLSGLLEVVALVQGATCGLQGLKNETESDTSTSRRIARSCFVLLGNAMTKLYLNELYDI